jgi:hypothetical protein
MDNYTTEKFWDCECEHNYIHPKEENYCEECHIRQEGQPDSIVSEVIKQGFKI